MGSDVTYRYLATGHLFIAVIVCHSLSVAAEILNPHKDENIGTVKQVYDATLLPDLSV